jgi:hypothetical protein
VPASHCNTLSIELYQRPFMIISFLRVIWLTVDTYFMEPRICCPRLSAHSPLGRAPSVSLSCFRRCSQQVFDPQTVVGGINPSNIGRKWGKFLKKAIHGAYKHLIAHSLGDFVSKFGLFFQTTVGSGLSWREAEVQTLVDHVYVASLALSGWLYSIS